MDLHGGNILLCLPEGIDNLSSEQLYEKYCQPNAEAEPIERLDDKPLPGGTSTHGVVSIWLGEKVTFLPSLKLGSSSLTLESHSCHRLLHGTIPRRQPSWLPPEVYFLSQTPLPFLSIYGAVHACFRALQGGSTQLLAGIIKENVDTLGKLPSAWWPKWDARLEWFSEEGTRRHNGESRSLVGRFNDSVHRPRQEYTIGSIGDDEKTALLAMFRAMLVFRPERLTAVQVLETGWMRNWVLPVFERG